MKLITVPGTACLLGFAWVSAGYAQSSPASDSLASLEQAAQSSSAAWMGLAKDLDTRVAHLLPCDARAGAALAEVSRASESRLTALAAYLDAAILNASVETNAAKVLLSRETTRATDDAAENTDAAKELEAIEKQLTALTNAAKQRPSLADASKALQEIDAMVKDRVTLASQQPGSAAAVQTALRDLVASFEARESALKDEAAAFEMERARWNGYYAARAARAQTECSITQVAPVKAPAAGKNR